MEIYLSPWECFIQGLQQIRFRFQQYMLKTNETVVVETLFGNVKGVKRGTLYGDSYFSFENIPYGQPPLGKLRFKAPRLIEPWKGIKDCTELKNTPTQQCIVNGFVPIILGSEDCLYLNIYTPKLESEKPLPVMVYIFGGGFLYGEASRNIYGPDYLIKEDVIVVTFQYRVGLFGFLSLKDPDLDIPGNAGLKDQLLALKWIKGNIACFNGDPENITIWGESAGAVSVHALMLSDQGKGLFHKAILHSGSAFACWSNLPYSNLPFRLAKYLGYRGKENETDILKYLMSCNAKQICRAQLSILTKEEIKNRQYYAFGPVVEPYITDHCVIPKDPVEMARTCWGNDIPMIIGGCAQEWLLIYKDTLENLHIIEELGDCRCLVPRPLCKEGRNNEHCLKLAHKLKNFYFGDGEPTAGQWFNYLELMGTKFFWHPIHRSVLSRVEYARSETYLFRFDFDSPTFNHIRNIKCGKNIRGVSHGDDLSYVLSNFWSNKLSESSQEYLMIRRMTSMWSHFARHGDPNTNLILPTIWKPAHKDQDPLKVLNISKSIKYIDHPLWLHLKLWDSLYENELI